MAERFPVFRAGQKVTGDLLASMQPLTARKVSDTSRASTTTTTADPELQFSVEANAVYTMDGWIKYDAVTAADISMDWSAPSGSLGEWTGSGAANDIAGAASGYLIQVAATDITTARSFGGGGIGVLLTVNVYGTLRVGSTAGTYSFDWAQLASNATATTVYADSWVRLIRIA